MTESKTKASYYTSSNNVYQVIIVRSGYYGKFHVIIEDNSKQEPVVQTALLTKEEIKKVTGIEYSDDLDLEIQKQQQEISKLES